MTVRMSILHGNVIASIRGGSSRQVPVDSIITLDDSASTDEINPFSSLTYQWSCSIASEGPDYSDCSSAMFADVVTSVGDCAYNYLNFRFFLYRSSSEHDIFSSLI